MFDSVTFWHFVVAGLGLGAGDFLFKVIGAIVKNGIDKTS